MVGEEVLTVLPEELINRVGSLITLLQAVGILAVIYFLWMLIKGFLTLKMNKKIVEIQKDIKKIKKKLKIK